MPLHLETHEIRVFRTVYEESGFNKAAEKAAKAASSYRPVGK